MVSSLAFRMPGSSSVESDSRAVAVRSAVCFPMPSSTSLARPSSPLPDQTLSSPACFPHSTPMRTVVSPAASGSGPACDPHAKFAVYTSARDVHGDGVFHQSADSFTANGKRRRLEGSSSRRAEPNGPGDHAHSGRNTGQLHAAGGADPTSHTRSDTQCISPAEGSAEETLSANNTVGRNSEGTSQKLVEEGASAVQGRSEKDMEDGAPEAKRVIREAESLSNQSLQKSQLPKADGVNDQHKKDMSVDAAPVLNERCSLCGQPRLWGRRERENGDKEGACEAGAGANDDDDAWVCEACLQCAEADVKKEEELLRQRQEQAKPRHTAQERVKNEDRDRVRLEHERRKDQRSSKGRNASVSAGAASCRSPTVPTNQSGSISQNRLPFSTITTTSSAADFSQNEPERTSWNATVTSGDKRGDVSGSAGTLTLEREGAPGATGPPASRGAALPPGVAAASPPAAAKRTDEGTIRSTTVHVGPNHQVPALPAFFLDSSCWPRPPSDAVLDPSLTARLVYSPSALQRIRLRREQEGRKDRAIVSEADMTAFVKACSQNWKTRPGWQPFSPEFAYKILHYAGYDPVRALQLMNDPQFSFREVCDPPLRKYDNKWKPKDRRGLIAATPYPPPISARGSLARRHHHREVSGYSLR